VKKLSLLFGLFLVGCPNDPTNPVVIPPVVVVVPPPVTPPPDPTVVTPPAPTVIPPAPVVVGCKSSCDNIKVLCPNDYKDSCVAVCQHNLQSNLTPMNMNCLTNAKTQDAIKSCGFVKCI
jgi:hypothetical protein